MTNINTLYGYLLDGQSSTRKTTADRAGLEKYPRSIIEALIPGGLSNADRELLAELYIRLCYTSKELIALLDKVDPINSYRIHSFYPTSNNTLDLGKIVDNLKKLGLPDAELSFLPVDYIVCGLKQLLTVLADA